MGPSRTAVSDDAFAFTTQRYMSEAKALQTQLQFNGNVPAVPENLALRFSHPRPIIIEKLKASSDQRNLVGSEDPSLRSSGIFSVVSEERLKLAVQLAKRDIKQRRLEEQVKQRIFGDVVSKPLWTQKSQQQKTEAFASQENKSALKSQTRLTCQQRLNQPTQGESASSDVNVYLCVKEGKPIPAVLDSPPTHDTGPGPKPNLKKKEHQNMQEVQRLQKELRSYVQKIEEIIKKGRDRELLDPEKEQQLCTRRQQQAARSARMLYVLQQQVKEIQDDLEKLSPHTIKHTKKSRAVSRLAAAHRGAVRTLQAFANQFTNQIDEQIPAYYKELGSLIRQLSLCSAKLEGDSSISEVIIDILLQVEDLNSLLENKQTPKPVKKCIPASQARPPRNIVTFLARKHLLSPKGENKPLTLKGQHRQESKKPLCAKSLLTAVQQANSCAHILHNKYQEESGSPTPERNDTLQGSADALVRARAVKEESVLESGALKKKDMLLPAKPQGMLKCLKSRQAHPPGKHARFQEPTIAFQLKESKRPVKESKMPCMPSKPAPRSVPPKRLARLEAKKSRGVKVLSDLCRGEMEKIQKLRSQTVSSAQCADKAGKEVQEWSEPPLHRTQWQVAANADILSEKLLDDLLEETAQELWSMDQHGRLQTEAITVADAHSLESMLQRMEEIEMYQEAVRRRVTQIVYSDSQFWAQADKMEQQMASTAKKLISPHPVQITKLIGHTELETDILLEKPFDSTDIDENKEAEEKLQTGDEILQPLPLNSLQKAHSVSLSVPSDVLQSILDYNCRYNHHLKLISHEVVGSFDPWQIAESLADQLTEEALCDVAVELQDVCEDYAEAVFTSEFLQPVQ